MGHEPSTTNPARIRAETSVSQASGDLLAKTITSRPSSRSAAWNRENARAMPSSQLRFEASRSPPKRAASSMSSPSLAAAFHFGPRGVSKALSISGDSPCRVRRSQTWKKSIRSEYGMAS